jgi:hypothetical protein
VEKEEAGMGITLGVRKRDLQTSVVLKHGISPMGQVWVVISYLYSIKARK